MSPDVISGLFFFYLRRTPRTGLKPGDSSSIENGSWAPSAARVMREMFGAMKDVTLVEPAVTLRSRLKTADLPALEALADALLA